MRSIVRVPLGLLLILLLADRATLAQRLFDDGLRELTDQIAAGMGRAQKRKVAVAALTDVSAGQITVLSIALAEELTTRLVNAPGVEVVERAMLDKVMAELKLGSSGAIDPATAKQVGKVAGVDAIVTGTITDMQSSVSVNLRVIDVETGRIFAAAQSRIVKDDDLRAIMRQPAGGQTAQLRPDPQAAAPPGAGIGSSIGTGPSRPGAQAAAPAAVRRGDLSFSSPACRSDRQAQREDHAPTVIIAARNSESRDTFPLSPRRNSASAIAVVQRRSSSGLQQAPSPASPVGRSGVTCELLVTNEGARALNVNLCSSYLVDSTGRRAQTPRFDFGGRGLCGAMLEPGIPQRLVMVTEDLAPNAPAVTIVLMDGIYGSFSGSATLRDVPVR